MQAFKYFIHGILTGLLIAAILFYIGLSRKILNSTEPPVKVEKIIETNVITQERESAITKAVEEVSPAVVGINVLKARKEKVRTVFDNDPFFSNFFPPQYQNKIVPSMGSGFIYTPDGYIITNDHVVKDAQRIIITTTEGKEYDARIIGSDEISDIAVLKIDVADHAYVKLGNEKDITRGEWVIAFGNPYGLFEYVNKPLITVGVVSGIKINFGFNTADKHFYENMIQTDASINPGNSGGPLVNSKGEVIGMNTMIYSSVSGGSIGIGFAIPINKIKDISQTLIKKGSIDRNFFFGFKLADYPEAAFTIKQNTGKDNITGVKVTEIHKNGPADKAGFKAGDIIIAVDNIKIDNFNDMGKALLELKDYKVGDKIEFVIYRNEDYKKLNMILESYKQ